MLGQPAQRRPGVSGPGRQRCCHFDAALVGRHGSPMPGGSNGVVHCREGEGTIFTPPYHLLHLAAEAIEKEAAWRA